MFEKCFSFMYFFCCFGFVISLNTIFLSFSFLYYNITNIPELIWTICLGVYYFIVILFYLGLFGLIVKNSFDHVEKIIYLNDMRLYESQDEQQDYNKDTRRIFKHILLNLVFLVVSVFLNYLFDYLVVKIPLILYICWTLGFTASLRINRDLCNKINNNQLKDYILLKSVINTTIFIGLYFLIKTLFYN